jgi:hypothetical protein
MGGMMAPAYVIFGGIVAFVGIAGLFMSIKLITILGNAIGLG